MDTGLVWGRAPAWKALRAIVPPFTWPHFEIFMGKTARRSFPPADTFTPGGFKPFEHRWALPEAFALHERLGRARVAQRTAALNQQLKEGLQKVRGLTLHTPMAPELSAGINCFEVAGATTAQVVARLREKKIVASTSPYATEYARLSANVVNTPAEVDRVLAAMRA